MTSIIRVTREDANEMNVLSLRTVVSQMHREILGSLLHYHGTDELPCKEGDLAVWYEGLKNSINRGDIDPQNYEGMLKAKPLALDIRIPEAIVKKDGIKFLKLMLEFDKLSNSIYNFGLEEYDAIYETAKNVKDIYSSLRNHYLTSMKTLGDVTKSNAMYTTVILPTEFYTVVE